MIPIITMIIPNIMGRKLNDAMSIELSEPISIGEPESNPANRIKRKPPINNAMPPIIAKIAKIVTPIGLFVFEFKLISKVN